VAGTCLYYHYIQERLKYMWDAVICSLNDWQRCGGPSSRSDGGMLQV
jgi:hypothetical protein